jgi:pimeloyl-ACP methyl ester carboxylesterase
LILTPISWLIPPLVRVGWLTTRVPNPPPDRARGSAFLLRGNGAIFTPGFGRLCARLRSAGVWAEDLLCIGDRWVARHLSAARDAGKVPGPITLIGHSRGGRRAIVAARRLEALGIAVDLLVCVDVAFPPPLPANVRRAVHVYRGRWRLYPARPFVAAPGAPARVDNVDLDAAGAPVPAAGLHHLNMTASAPLHDWVVAQVIGELR